MAHETNSGWAYVQPWICVNESGAAAPDCKHGWQGSSPIEKRSFSQNRRLAAEAGRKGGQTVPGAKRSFSQNRELAAVAGRKGGQSVPDEKRSFSQNPELAAEAGRKGGQASHGGGAAVRTPTRNTGRPLISSALRRDGEVSGSREHSICGAARMRPRPPTRHQEWCRPAAALFWCVKSFPF